MPSTPDALAATSIGYLIRPWRAERGTVHSAYRTAVNLSLPAMLCTLAPARIPDGPATIRIGEADWPRLPGVRRGDPVALRGATLLVGSARIDLRTATVWQPGDLPGGEAPGVLERCAGLRAAALRRGGAAWIPDSVRAVLGVATDPVEAVRPLLGRGVGLTPAGDDAIVGALAACWLTSGACEAPATRDRLARGVRPQLGGTTDLSAAFLSMALEGHFQRPVWEAAEAIVAGARSMERLRLLAVGATSGPDCALGLACTTEFIITQPNKVAA